jgi:hypothetical protein
MVFAADGSHVATHRRADLCGVASHSDSFTLTDGLGAVWAVDDTGLQPLASGTTLWDNHLVALTV